MALAALIAAYQQEEGGSGLRATLPVAGRTLLEYQARQAARAGAAHLVVLVERMPAELLAAIDRLRGDGLRIDIARTVADAADRVHPEERLLFVGDGCLAAGAWTARIASARVPTLLTVSDSHGGAHCERIDAGTRWAGLALLDGTRLRHISSMLGEWDLQSTLLRSAVQESAARIDASGANDLGDPEELWLAADRLSALSGFDRKLAGARPGAARDWADRLIAQPIVRQLLPPLLRTKAQSWWFSAGAVALTLLSAILFLGEWRWPAIIALLLGGPLLTLASRLDHARLLPGRASLRAETLRDACAILPLLAFGWAMSGPAGWGAFLLALWTAGAMAAQRTEAEMLRRRGSALPGWRAGVDALAWLFVPAAISGAWLIVLVTMAIYAAASFAGVQMRLRRRLAAETVSPQV